MAADRVRVWVGDEIPQARVDRAFHHVRCELHAHGLLDEGFYLDGVDLYRTRLPNVWQPPSARAMGYVVEWELGFDYERGKIFIPRNAPIRRDIGHTLRDVIRHEFAHAWHVLDPRRVDGTWFRDVFGGRYDDPGGAKDEVEFYEENPETFEGSTAWRDHVSVYAASRPKEDFAETFMFFLRDGGSAARFRGRPGAQRKLRAVRDAVARTAKSLRP